MRFDHIPAYNGLCLHPLRLESSPNNMGFISGRTDTGMASDGGQSVSGQAQNQYPLLGLPEIDSQHLALFTLFDRLIGKPHSHPVAEPFSEILSQLGRQIADHFDSEESLLKACGMPRDELAEHLAAHEKILEEYSQLNLDLMAGKAIGQQSILEMVRRWIVDHIHQYDFRIRDYLSVSRDQG